MKLELNDKNFPEFNVFFTFCKSKPILFFYCLSQMFEFCYVFEMLYLREHKRGRQNCLFSHSGTSATRGAGDAGFFNKKTPGVHIS